MEDISVELKEQIEMIAKKACSEIKIALYDVELKRASKGLIVLIYVTKINGVTIDECKKISRIVSEVLEVEDIIKERYYLEVSSPGLERDLTQKKHYVSAIGEKVKLTYSHQDKNITSIGVLKEVLPESIKLEFADEVKLIELTDVKKAKTYFDYKK